jgi:phage protein D
MSAPDLRRPRLRVLGDDGAIGGVFEADVVSNNHFSADRFHLGVAVSADPAGAAGLMGRAGQMLDVQIALDDHAPFTSLVKGEVDQVRLDVTRGVLRVEGRDLSARLMETRTAELFANMTAGDIVRDLAARHGLAADVASGTGLVGRGWMQEGARLGRERLGLGHYSRLPTEWDVLVGLAWVEGFDVWVDGETLHFRPALPTSARLLTPSSVSVLRLERALTLAGDIEVVVRSWNVAQHQAFAQTARRAGAQTARRAGGQARAKGGRRRRYVYVVPGLAPDEALKLAQARLAEITRHERVVSIDMPGDLAIMPRQRLRLAATGTDFDQDYWVDRVERRISVAHGFQQSVQARNSSDGQARSSSDGQARSSSDGQEGSPWSSF